MPKIWSAKDGPRPYSQSGPGIPASHDEVEAIFSGYELVYHGLEPESINRERPTKWPVNVLVELEESESCTALLPQVGFYQVLGMRPEEAERALDECRSKPQEKQ